MSSTDFIPDCANCTALCCIAFAFDKGEHFAHGKDAGEPCKNLNHHLCSIHSDLDKRGYSGCTAYTCLGAGQRVTAMFGQSWQDQPKLTAPIINAFRTMKDIQELRQLLEASASLSLPAIQSGERTAWLDALSGNWTRESLDQFDRNRTSASIRMWLRGLAAYLPR
ncbi:MAG: hypothetical protein ABF243_01685 [Celeribacter marinus]